MYRYFLRPLFFLFSPEAIHTFVFDCLKFFLNIPLIPFFVRSYFIVRHPALKRVVFGLTFPNPVGLAAGFDKNAKVTNEFACLGPGFIEIGTVTPLPQPGNPKPRIFRLTKDQALLNRMGFNNDGADVIVNRLKSRTQNAIIGVNLGKNKDTSLELAIKDYEIGFEKFFDVADYFVINVSSPNTPGLRSLQEKKPLSELLNHISLLNKKKKNPKPVLVKISPDNTDSQLDDIIEIVSSCNISGIIATNTTISREGLRTSSELVAKLGSGGISGKPIKNRSDEVIRYIVKKSNGTIPVIASGGIFSEEDAMDKLNAGACLVQLYTGLIYEGPELIRKINKRIIRESSLTNS